MNRSIRRGHTRGTFEVPASGCPPGDILHTLQVCVALGNQHRSALPDVGTVHHGCLFPGVSGTRGQRGIRQGLELLAPLSNIQVLSHRQGGPGLFEPCQPPIFSSF